MERPPERGNITGGQDARLTAGETPALRLVLVAGYASHFVFFDCGLFRRGRRCEIRERDEAFGLLFAEDDFFV